MGFLFGFGFLALALVIAIIVIYVMLGCKVAAEAKRRGESYGFYLAASILLSPLVTAIVLQVTSDKTRTKVENHLSTISQNVYASAEILKDIRGKKENE